METQVLGPRIGTVLLITNANNTIFYLWNMTLLGPMISADFMKLICRFYDMQNMDNADHINPGFAKFVPSLW